MDGGSPASTQKTHKRRVSPCRGFTHLITAAREEGAVILAAGKASNRFSFLSLFFVFFSFFFPPKTNPGGDSDKISAGLWGEARRGVVLGIRDSPRWGPARVFGVVLLSPRTGKGDLHPLNQITRLRQTRGEQKLQSVGIWGGCERPQPRKGPAVGESLPLPTQTPSPYKYI